MLDPTDMTLSLRSTVHGHVTNCTVNVPVWSGLERIAGFVAARDTVHGPLRVRRHLVLQLLDLLRLGRPLPVGLAGNVGLVGLLTGDGQVTNITSHWFGLEWKKFFNGNS